MGLETSPAWDATRAVAFVLCLLLSWPFYLCMALSYLVYSRTNLHLRVRVPWVMLVNLAVGLFCVTLVCLREIFDALHLGFPCWLTNIGFAAYLCNATLFVHVRSHQLLSHTSGGTARTSIATARKPATNPSMSVVLWALAVAFVAVVTLLDLAPVRFCRSMYVYSAEG